MLSIAAIEHPRGDGVRDRYGVFQIGATKSVSDYRLAVVKASDPVPSSSALEAGSHIKRNIGTTSKYVLMSYALSASLTGTPSVSTLLEPSTRYAVYGMEAGGTPAKLLEFNTDAVITSATTNNTTRYMDSSLSTITISARSNEKLIMPNQFQLDWKELGYENELIGIKVFNGINEPTGHALTIGGRLAPGLPAYYNDQNFLVTGSFSVNRSLAIRTLYWDISYAITNAKGKIEWYYLAAFGGGQSDTEKALLWAIEAE